MKRYLYDIPNRIYVERENGAVCAYSNVADLARRCLSSIRNEDTCAERVQILHELEQIVKEST